MKLSYPYKVEINTQDEAINYIKNQCKNCPIYRANWDCSGATVMRCQQAIYLVIEEFGNKSGD